MKNYFNFWIIVAFLFVAVNIAAGVAWIGNDSKPVKKYDVTITSNISEYISEPKIVYSFERKKQNVNVEVDGSRFYSEVDEKCDTRLIVSYKNTMKTRSSIFKNINCEELSNAVNGEMKNISTTTEKLLLAFKLINLRERLHYYDLTEYSEYK